MRIENLKCLMTAAAVATWTLLAVGGVSPGDYGTPRAILHAPAEAVHQHLAWPKVVKSDSGLVLVCVSGARHGAVDDACEAASISTDGGENWSAPSYFTYPASAADWPYKGNLALGAEGNRVNLLSMAYDNGVNPKSGIIGRISDDGGVTWRYADTSAISSNKTGSVFGHIIDIPGRGLTAFGHYRPPARAQLGGIWMSSSADRGETWSAPTAVLEKSGTVEPDFVYSKGRLIGLIREDKVDGSGAINGYWQIVSDDNGATWSVPKKVMVDPAGGQSAAPCIFEDPSERGRLYALQTRRRGNFGTSSCTGEIIVWTAKAKDLVWREAGTVASFSGVEDWGYASAASLGDGEWFVVFYAGNMSGANSIYGARCAFVPPAEETVPALTVRSVSVRDGKLSMTADCSVDGKLWLASGETDGGENLDAWDNVTLVRGISAGERLSVEATLPEGAAFARIVVREVSTQLVQVVRPYLEGDGGQYLEVDYKLKSTDRVVAKVMGLADVVSDTGLRAGIFGSRVTTDLQNISALWATAGAVVDVESSGSVVLDFCNTASSYAQYRKYWPSLKTNVLYTVEMSAASRRVLEGSQSIAPSEDKPAYPNDFETATNCRLFDVLNKPGSYVKYFIGRFYEFKIYQGDNQSPVRDLVPFVDTDGKAKMKDRVAGGIYGNLGTGDFRYGEVTEEEEVEVDGRALGWGPRITRNAILDGSFDSSLTHPKFIDVQNVMVESGVKLKSSDRVEVKIRMHEAGHALSVFCQRDRLVSGAPNRFFLFGVTIAGRLYPQWNFDYADQHDNEKAFGKQESGVDYVLSCSTNGAFCNGVRGFTPTYADFEANSTMELFASRNATTDAINNQAHLRFYWLRVYDATGVLKAEILPWTTDDGSGWVAVRQFEGGRLVSEELKGSVAEEGGNGTIRPSRRIVASFRRGQSLIVTIAPGQAANVYCASGRKAGGEDPSSWRDFTFVRTLSAGTSRQTFAIPLAKGVRYAKAFLGEGPTDGDLTDGLEIVDAGDVVPFFASGLLLFIK